MCRIIIKCEIILILICLFSLPTQAKYGGGTGEPNDPYRIATAEDLILLGESPEDYDKHFVLTADIDLDPNLPGRKVFDRAVIASDTDADTRGFHGSRFTGVFDGYGHTISNLTIRGEDYLGLFGQLKSGSEVKDLGVVDVNITGSYFSVGALAGASRSLILNCYSSGSVSGAAYIGGLVGINGDEGTIINCYSMNNGVSGNSAIGGLIGENDGTVASCYSRSNVFGGSIIGGLVGEMFGFYATITDCYSTGSVSGESFVGGMVGYIELGSTIINCYSTGSVSGERWVGGLVGDTYGGGRVFYSYWDIETSGQTESAVAEGKTTLQMKDTKTFLHWIAEPAMWTIDEGNDYPRLAWEQQQSGMININVLSEFLQGRGTQSEPYLISDANELELVGGIYQEEIYFKLVSDIDLSGRTYTQAIIQCFSGIFDGAGFTIRNLSIDTEGVDNDYLGLLGRIDETGKVKELNMENVIIISGENSGISGGLAGWNLGTITASHLTGGMIAGRSVIGGLVGWNYGTITASHSTSSVTGTIWIGGLVGWNTSGTITDSYASGSVSASQDPNGDFVEPGSHIGGLVGSNESGGTIINCFATGMVSGNRGVGGLVGGHWSGIIKNCYATGSVLGRRNVGGLVGKGHPDRVSRSFWDIESSGQSTSGGGTGKTTAEMQMQSTFTDAGWDFVDETENGTEDIWWILEGEDYPRLWWELNP